MGILVFLLLVQHQPYSTCQHALYYASITCSISSLLILLSLDAPFITALCREVFPLANLSTIPVVISMTLQVYPSLLHIPTVSCYIKNILIQYCLYTTCGWHSTSSSVPVNVYCTILVFLSSLLILLSHWMHPSLQLYVERCLHWLSHTDLPRR